ncbi:hypothetical protein P5V15_014747 [Pogonomyrmex californicus]
MNKRSYYNNKLVINEMMTLDAEPFALVERKGFQRLIKYLAPQYPLVEHIFRKNYATSSFISLTAHFIRNDDMQREILVLSAKHFPDSHTGFNTLGQILNDVMEEWHISSSQIHKKDNDRPRFVVPESMINGIIRIYHDDKALWI